MRHSPIGSIFVMAAAIGAANCVLIRFPQMGLAQDATTRKHSELASAPKAIPSDLTQQLQVLGSRMRIAGKEESVFEGQLLNATGQQKPLRVIHQIAGVVRIESPREKTVLSFDGEETQGIRDHDGESLLDTFVSDSPEGMFYAVRHGGSMQLLGRGFVSDSKRSDDRAPRYDIYEVTSPDRTNKSSGLRARRYYFDSQTGLLASTRYTDRNGVEVETRFLAWIQVDGSAYPSRIERYEDARLTLSFVAGTVAATSKQDSVNFK